MADAPCSPSMHSWAQEEFGEADLGDLRLTRRTVDLAAAMAARPAGRVTSVVQTSAEREGAFRLLRNKSVCVERLGQSSFASTIRRLHRGEQFIVAVDQTGLAVTDREKKKGFGPAGSNPIERVRGLQAMSALALRTDGTCLGLCGQKWWCRSDTKASDWKEDERPVEERESSLWHSAIAQTEQTLSESGTGARAWYQLDRGGDSYHVLEKARDEGLSVTVRSAYDRALADGSGGMREKVASTKVVGGLKHYLRPRSAKRAGHSPRRARNLSVRAARVCIRLTQYRPNFRRTSMDLWVVHVREKNPPRGCERLEWYLQTTVPVESRADALKVAAAYCLRWRVEEFHKT